MKLDIGVQNISWETLHEYKTTLNLLVNFCTNTAYKQPILLIFQNFVIKFRETWTWWEKMSFILVFSREKKLTEYWKFILGIFLQASVYIDTSHLDVSHFIYLEIVNIIYYWVVIKNFVYMFLSVINHWSRTFFIPSFLNSYLSDLSQVW